MREVSARNYRASARGLRRVSSEYHGCSCGRCTVPMCSARRRGRLEAPLRSRRRLVLSPASHLAEAQTNARGGTIFSWHVALRYQVSQQLRLHRVDFVSSQRCLKLRDQWARSCSIVFTLGRRGKTGDLESEGRIPHTGRQEPGIRKLLWRLHLPMTHGLAHHYPPRGGRHELVVDGGLSQLDHVILDSGSPC